MKNKDNQTLEKIASILIKVNKNLISDKKAIEDIMRVMLNNSNRKLKEYLYKEVK